MAMTMMADIGCSRLMAETVVLVVTPTSGDRCILEARARRRVLGGGGGGPLIWLDVA